MVEEKLPSKPAAAAKAAPKKAPPREIPGNFPYTTSPGVLKQILQKIITAERPTKFSGDFLSTVLGFTGGSAMVVPPILKRTNFLNADATPTEQYNRFKSESHRSQAVYDALKSGYAELFKRNEFAHKLDEAGLKDLLVTITGLNKADSIVRAIAGTFLTFRSFMDTSKTVEGVASQSRENDDVAGNQNRSFSEGESDPSIQKIGLSYNINIVIPNTDDPSVLNAIFRSLKENLLR